MLNKKAKVNSVHISLNFDPSDKLNKDGLKDIADTYMQKIGFGEQPYLVYQHNDAGHHLSPYELVEDMFINELIAQLGIEKGKIVLVPGNHDLDKSKVTDPSETGLLGKSTIEGINTYIENYRSVWHEGYMRIEDYKSFENKFYKLLCPSILLTDSIGTLLLSVTVVANVCRAV